CIDDTWIPTAGRPPDARDNHTAVWTGSEMIVWGGYDNSGYFNTGGRYNPSTVTWTATSTTNAASARGFHTAVWTGSEMIVWGGGGSVFKFGRGASRETGKDGVTATSATNTPAGRGHQQA